MSKARLVITAVVTEGRSQGEVARAYGVSQGWVSRLVARYRAGAEAAFEPRSRRPKTSPGAIRGETAELIVRLRKELAGHGLDAGPHTICWHLEHHHHVRVSAATVSRYLTPATPGPRPSRASPAPPARPGPRRPRRRRRASSPSATTASSPTSASAEPTPEPASSCSSTTSRSALSTPPPANSSASSPSTPTATTSPPAGHPDPRPELAAKQEPRTQMRVRGHSDVLRHHIARSEGLEPLAFRSVVRAGGRAVPDTPYPKVRVHPTSIPIGYARRCRDSL